MNKLRVIVADDERPAREFLKKLLAGFEYVDVIGEAENGVDALELIKAAKPDLAFLDLQMPEFGGLEIVRLLRKNQMPLVAFVTAFDDFAIKAFELNAIDYLLKPVEKARLRETIERTFERLESDDWREAGAERLNAISTVYRNDPDLLERIPVKRGDDILLVPVGKIASVIADGELLHLTTEENQKYTINFRLKDLEERLGAGFVRLSRGALVNLDAIARVSPVPGGTYLVTLKNGSEIPSSRLQSKLLRSKLFKLNPL